MKSWLDLDFGFLFFIIENELVTENILITLKNRMLITYVTRCKEAKKELTCLILFSYYSETHCFQFYICFIEQSVSK